jgi:DNA polymerase-3 subunit gamma/tau
MPGARDTISFMAKAKDSKDIKPKPVPAAPVEASGPDFPEPAGYTVVARRYRPQQFADLIGQEHVASALAHAIESGRIAHAYLFTGARGVGKTSAARILAKAMNCVKGPTPTPCDECDICRSIAAGDDVDSIEIDGASNNKVDEARDLRSNVGFRPTRARYKIYIIDEVHMLTTGAFNALLKTLEEPPAHVKFILATTEVQKIPITILSRCQRFDFATVNALKIFDALKRIVGLEGLKADDDALQIVAKRANGSMRDSQTLLDQLLSFSDGPLTADRVHSLFGTASDVWVKELAEAVLAGKPARALDMISEAAARGLQLGELTDQIIDYWRGLMLNGIGVPGTPASSASLDTILAGLDIWTTTKARMRGSPHTQILLEMALVRLSRLEEMLSVAQLAQWVGGAEAPAGSAPRAALPVSEAAKKNTVSVGSEVKANGQPVVASPDTVEGIWPRLKAEIGPVLSARLAQTPLLPAIFGPTSLAIRFPHGYTAAVEFLREERSGDELRKALKKISGRDWQVRIDELPADPNAAPAASANGKASVKVAAEPGRRSDFLQLPFIQAAVEVLGAQLMKVEDGFDPNPVRALGGTGVEDDDEVPAAADSEES